ncbi:unnamed protein product [Cuscuta epithymum]|uniref:TITAN-like protein n=1 Tax=Cuscuta epithymum TaxID=186058 RepID=A0AAV0GGP1_9ASTE|nr:unnamed protein product [Cuscuta epithymum]
MTYVYIKPFFLFRVLYEYIFWGSTILHVLSVSLSSGYQRIGWLDNRHFCSSCLCIIGLFSYYFLAQLIEISISAEEAIIGNVHSGAPPPWLDAFEQNQMDSLSKSGQNGLDSLCQKSKCSKLNPKRVGAAWAEKRKLEMELEKKGELVMKNADANWLPNFGRVWQTGSRKESRKEFQIEKKLSGKIESQSSSVIQLQPYISKRMRKDLVDIPEQPSSPE